MRILHLTDTHLGAWWRVHGAPPGWSRAGDHQLGLQRALGAAGGVVMDGRDIGTVVLPDSELKIYLDAALDERARRRHEELVRRGETVPVNQVRAGLAFRDKQDSERAVAPLKQAEDALFVDSTALSAAQVVDKVLALARERGADA